MVSDIRRLLSFCKCSKQFITLLLLRSPFEAGSTVANALFLQNAFNAVSQNDNEGLTRVCLAFGGLMLLLFLYNGAIWSIYAPFITKLEGRLRLEMFNKISALSCEKIESAPKGDLMTRLNTDVQMPFSQPIHLPHLACSVINIIVSSAILCAMNTEVFGLVLLFVIPHILFSQFFIAKAMPELMKNSIKAVAENTYDLSPFVTCADSSAVYDAGGYLLNKFCSSSMKLLKANMKIKRKNAISNAIAPIFGMGGYLAILLFSSEWISSGLFSFGDLTAAFQFRNGILVGTMMLISSIVNIRSSLAGIRRVNEILAEEGCE